MSTIDAYNRYSNVYDAETIQFWQKFPAETVQSFVSRLGGKRVLDLGSGPGRGAQLLRERGALVTCLDAAPAMIQMTMDLGFKSICADMRQMKLTENSFEGVWAYTSLLHLPEADLPAAVRRALRLKPGDKLVWRVNSQATLVSVEPAPRKWGQYMKSLDANEWKGVDAQEYVNDLREDRDPNE